MRTQSQVTYVSTRGNSREIDSAEAIICGLATDKGLYVPTHIPTPAIDYDGWANVPYRDVSLKILKSFLTDFEITDLRKCVDGAYDEKFDSPKIAPLANTSKACFLELYHGRTAAFKDMALSILPYLLTTAIRKKREDNKIIILTATSGDTGKAALEGFSDVTGTEIFVFYPKDGVSEIQQRQMITQRGGNVHVFAVDGNFDDAQNGVKQIFNDDEFGRRLAVKGYRLSSANSINIGRLIPQVAYYVYAYIQMIVAKRVKSESPINIVVPTGNFGNILAAWYAMQMGLPVNKLICASNENKVLTDFINTGVYDANRQFYLTSSPSMDILISSNLERLLWHLSGGNAPEIASYMRSLDETGRYSVSDTVRRGMSKFWAGYADMRETHNAIATLWNEEKYLMDTHTAVAYSVYMDYRAHTGDQTPTLIASTASAYKFADNVSECIGLPKASDGFAYIEELNKATGVQIPDGLKNLKNKTITQNYKIHINQMRDAIMQSLV